MFQLKVSNLLRQGLSHVWHKQFTSPVYKVLGYIACRVTSKILGIGSAERSWGAVKHLKTDKRAQLSGETVKKQATLFGAACIEEARRRKSVKAAPDETNIIWDDQDVAFDLKLESWGVDVDDLRKKKIPKRIFRAWEEDWELEIRKKQDVVNEARLVEKYKGLVIFDPDYKKMRTITDQVQYQGGHGGAGYCAIAVGDDGEINDTCIFTYGLLIEQILETTQPKSLHLKIIKQKEDEKDNDDDDDDDDDDGDDDNDKDKNNKNDDDDNDDDDDDD